MLSQTSPGPIVHGQKTTIHLLPRASLDESAFLPGIFDVINSAFSHSHPPYIPASFKRLLSLSQIGTELGPDAFTLIVTVPAADSSSAPQVIATGSALPAAALHAAGKAVEADADVAKTTVQRSSAARCPLPETVDWELKHLCVRPESMRQGLAGLLLPMLEAEVRRRAHGICKDGHGERAKGRIRLMITTINALNGPWYQRRGFEVVEHSSHPAGTLGGTAAFEIWHMDKILISSHSDSLSR